MNQIGTFNEEYFGDKESQEYCYRAHDTGYNNYLFTITEEMFYETIQVRFGNKVSDKKYDVDKYLAVKNDTVKRFRDKWIPWEERQYYRFK